ncbi:MAG: MarR family transcriptional regulator [Eggerthellaceae bacterium]|nr:MarR family transcriptional regulator [Eggerthellaceae bacterium]
MELRYPISTELFTFVHQLNRTVEQALRREHGLSVVQYRAISCLRQAGEMREADIVRILAAKPSHLSRALGGLAARGCVESRTHGGPAKLWKLTDAGHRLIEGADAVVIEACNQVFGPLGAELGRAIRSGSMLTNQRHGVIRIENGRFFEEHACFEAFLQSERITKESTKAFDLTENEFRILYLLYCDGPTSKSALAQSLLLALSVVSDACRSLEGRALIAKSGSANDKRVHTMALTEHGRKLTEQAAVHVDTRAYEDLRPSSTEERALYQRMADIVSHGN